LAPPYDVPDPQLEDLLVYFEKRAAHIPQGGEVCLPGGGIDKGESSEAAALREWQEETGIPSSQLEMLGCFGTLVHLSSRSIDVWIAEGPDPRTVTPSPNEEVDILFTTSLRELMESKWESFTLEFEVHSEENFPIAAFGSRRPAQHLPVWFVRGLPDLLWGMTAGIMRQFLHEVFGRYPG
jgi:8-oxo-dGTP pyrophosphatase MutT (NUDIX family)